MTYSDGHGLTVRCWVKGQNNTKEYGKFLVTPINDRESSVTALIKHNGEFGFDLRLHGPGCTVLFQEVTSIGWILRDDSGDGGIRSDGSFMMETEDDPLGGLYWRTVPAKNNFTNAGGDLNWSCLTNDTSTARQAGLTQQNNEGILTLQLNLYYDTLRAPGVPSVAAGYTPTRSCGGGHSVKTGGGKTFVSAADAIFAAPVGALFDATGVYINSRELTFHLKAETTAEFPGHSEFHMGATHVTRAPPL